MTEQSEQDQPADDVEGHRHLTPDQAQARADAARRERERPDPESAGTADRDS